MNSVKIKYFAEGSQWTECRIPAPATTATVPAGSPAIAAGAGAVSGAESGSLSGSVGGGTKGFLVCTIDVATGTSSTLDMDMLNEILLSSSPTILLIHNATSATRKQLMQSMTVRKRYGISDLVRYERKETVDKGSVALILYDAHVESAENATKQLEKISNSGENYDSSSNDSTSASTAVKLFLVIHLRTVERLSVTTIVVYVDPLATHPQRRSALTAVTSLPGSMDVTLLCSNLVHSSMDSDMRAMCTSRGFVDAAEEATEKLNNVTGPVQQDWSLWVKTTKLTVTNYVQDLFTSHKGITPVTTVTVGPRGPMTIVIPQPRSAKSSGTRGTAWLGATSAIITDPAILSAEAGGRSTNTQQQRSSCTAIIDRLAQQQHQQQASGRWRTTSTYTLKPNDKLSKEEMAFDISPYFSSPADAVEALNSRSIYWPADFCVVQNVILASDTVGTCDKRTAFRKYAKEYKNSAMLQSQMFLNSGASAGVTMTGAQDRVQWLKRAMGTSAEHEDEKKRHSSCNNNSTNHNMGVPVPIVKREEETRVRCWDISWCTIVYQVTPREMKFNITSVVGLGKDNISEAIKMLNARSLSKSKSGHTRENPLFNYAYDYALLFSMELQGYWLIAATDVPCDIVACRAAA
uniref:Uncharacterized protein n=1 Tax=Trypanosoma vivax (strain Y486) TaxID=1055687 RepID=G0TR01_TRYVY|nr:conserved hypothetical protein [Trypanosoma vivax Y486]